MKIIRALIIFALIPLIAGYFVASFRGHKLPVSTNLNFNTGNVLPTDIITVAENGNIISVTQKEATTIPTKHPQLIEASPLDANYIGVDKQTNYSSLYEFSSTGTLLQTIQNGNTGNIDTMDWFTDPAVSKNQNEIAFVSDKDKDQTNVLDNALFIMNLGSGSVQKIVDPDPHSGGIAHPVWDPSDPNVITYDYYQYDDSFNPYSLIDEYNIQSQTTNALTTQKQNAYQGSFSPNGKQLIFLQRNNDITTGMYIANVTPNGLSNIQSLASGDFSYPQFSYTPNHIYYLQAQGNSGYDLYSATIENGKLTNANPVSTNEQLLGNSGFTVNRIQK
jgi:hypothetical protein